MEIFEGGDLLRRIPSLLLLLASPALAAPVIIEDIPAYNWYHGSGPTAAASVLGYRDLHGYPDLFDASGKDVFLSSNVQDQVPSPEHDAKYDPGPDDATLPVPPQTSIADFFRTSVDQAYGWSWQRDAPAAFGETIQWSPFHGMSIGDSWGVYASTFVDPVSSPVPEPATVLLLGAGLAVLAGCGRYRPRSARRRKIA